MEDATTNTAPQPAAPGGENLRQAILAKAKGNPILGLFEKIKNKKEHPDLNYYNAPRSKKSNIFTDYLDSVGSGGSNGQ